MTGKAGALMVPNAHKSAPDVARHGEIDVGPQCPELVERLVLRSFGQLAKHHGSANPLHHIHPRPDPVPQGKVVSGDDVRGDAKLDQQRHQYTTYYKKCSGLCNVGEGWRLVGSKEHQQNEAAHR